MKRAEYFGLLFRTLRHLKAEQLFFQGYYRIRRGLGRPKPRSLDFSRAELNAIAAREFTPPSGANACLDYNDGHFRFIGLEHQFDEGIDWQDAHHGKLWNYNLHYFEWLWSLDSSTAKDAVLDWILRHPCQQGAVGWEPYPLSLRVMNWLVYFGTVAPGIVESDSDFRVKWLQSIGRQCDWLMRHLERHLLGNHLLENGAALWMAGSLIQHPEATRWQQKGLQIMESQLREQVLADGMHFERSPMYHNRLIHLLEWLCAIPSANLVVDLHALLDKTQAAALKLRHPDGRIALFNDSAFGIYPEVDGESACGAFALKDAGYFGVRTALGDYWVCDAGRIGPDYLPGHAHCDVGSFELSLRGKRWITDTGVYNYETSEKRQTSRSTAAHNTFSPQGVEQAEIWSSFRVGERPDVVVREWMSTEDGEAVLELSHDGFERALKHNANYQRRMEFSAKQNLRITERFDSDVMLTWEGRLHFAPGVELVEHTGNRVVLQSGQEQVQVTLEGVDDVTTTETPYWAEFNTEHMRHALVYSRTDKQGEVRVVLDWSQIIPQATSC